MKEIAPNIYAMTERPGANAGLIVMPEGAIAVDAPTLPQDARAWRKKIMKTAKVPILYVILTDSSPDRTMSAGIVSGVEDDPSLGIKRAPIVATRAVYNRAAAYTDGFWRGVVESWSRRFPKEADDLLGRRGALPEIVFTDSITLHKGGLPVTIRQIEGATQGSAWIRLLDKNVLFVGDTVLVDTPPVLAATPDSKAWLDTLTALRRVSFAKTTIVPGRGPVCNQEDTRPLSEYIALARRRARSLYAAGQVRAEVMLVVAKMLDYLAIPEQDHDWVQRRLKAGLDRLCDELRQA